jgi:hypothetical protein
MRTNEIGPVQNPRLIAKIQYIHPNPLKPTTLKHWWISEQEIYLWKYLSYRLVGGRRKDELRKLLLDFKGYSPNGSPLISTLKSHLSGMKN